MLENTHNPSSAATTENNHPDADTPGILKPLAWPPKQFDTLFSLNTEVVLPEHEYK